MISVLFTTTDFVFVHKPAGILVHPRDDHREGNAGDAHLLELLELQRREKLWPVHRLDRPTSGVMCFARSAAAARQFQTLVNAQSVQKLYLAVVRGWPANQTIDAALQRHERDPVAALTKIRCLAKIDLPVAYGPHARVRLGLVAAQPITGRFHQIRRHLAGKGYPILGDTTHGDLRFNRLIHDFLATQGMFLHAAQLAFDTHMIVSQLPAGEPHWQRLFAAGAFSPELTLQAFDAKCAE